MKAGSAGAKAVSAIAAKTATKTAMTFATSIAIETATGRVSKNGNGQTTSYRVFATGSRATSVHREAYRHCTCAYSLNCNAPTQAPSLHRA